LKYETLISDARAKRERLSRIDKDAEQAGMYLTESELFHTEKRKLSSIVSADKSSDFIFEGALYYRVFP
jgi:hypothetical protein